MCSNAVRILNFNYSPSPMHVWQFAAVYVLWGTFTVGLAADAQQSELVSDIVLDASTREDPRFKFLLPPVGSHDELEFGAQGIVVKQTTDAGKKTQHLGFELQMTSKDHFLFMLDFECPKMVAPRQGWGQGLLIRLVTEDPQAPIMAIGYVANRKYKSALCYTANHTDTNKQSYVFQPESFKKGKLLIERKGGELFISVDESEVGSYRLLKRVACTLAPVKEVQVWCTRQASGNTPAQYLLKRVQWIGDSYFSQPPPSPPLVTWQRVKTFLFWSALLAGVVYVVQGVRTGKIPLYRP